MDDNQGGTPNPLNPGTGESSSQADLVSRFVLQTQSESTTSPNETATHNTPSPTKSVATTQPLSPTESPVSTPTPAAKSPAPKLKTAPASRPRPSAGTRPVMDIRPTAPAVATATTTTIATPTSNISPIATQVAATPATQPAVSPALDPITKAPQAAVSEVVPNKKAKKKRTLIISGIIAIVLAVGCGVAAALLMLNRNPANRVGIAVQKLINDGYSNVAVNGTIEATTDDKDALFSKIKIDLDSELASGTAANSTTATVTLSPRGSQENISAKFSEVYTKGSDLYIKTDGLADAVQELLDVQSFTTPAIVEDCVAEDGSESCVSTDTTVEKSTEVKVSDTANGISETIDCANEDCANIAGNNLEFLNAFSDIIDTIDGEWIRISSDALGDLSSETNTSDMAACGATLVDDLSNSTNSLSMLYQENPFIVSVSENIPVASKKYPIYQISINQEEFTKFAEAAQSLPATQNFLKCTGYSNYQIKAEDISNGLSLLPKIYVEVDDDYNFSRLYSVIETEDASITIDLDFSYPTNLNIVEPIEYQDLDTILQQYATNNSEEEAEEAPTSEE